jgi:NAD(P)-dependent dehydrogenase (short-subunit alcohol dehydrogenase family)
MKLRDKIAIITGAAGGMGQATALLFAEEGAAIAAVDLSEQSLESTLKEIRAKGGRAIGIGADITRTPDVLRIVERTLAELGKPNVLVNNAGVDTEAKRKLVDIPEEAFDRTVEVNLKAPWLMMKHVVPHMIEAGGGSIVNTASICAFVAINTVGYTAAKAGVVAMSKVAAVELGPHNIRVNALCPGATLTPLALAIRKEQAALGGPVRSNLVEKKAALGRMAEPMEMAKAALFLASDDSSFATGISFVNDGGWTANGGWDEISGLWAAR